jgi:hypothetical protein
MLQHRSKVGNYNEQVKISAFEYELCEDEHGACGNRVAKARKAIRTPNQLFSLLPRHRQAYFQANSATSICA